MAQKEMFPAMVNSVATSLSGGIGATDTVFYVLDDSRIPDPPNLLVLGENSALAETVKLTAKDGTKLTVIRGFQGAARSWDAGTTVSRNFTAYDHDAFKENIEILDAEQSGLNSKADAIIADLGGLNVKADEILSGVGETSAKTDNLRTDLSAVRTEITDTKTITDSVSGKIGENSNSADSSGTTLFSLIKYVVSMFASHFTSARAAKLDNLDMPVSTRASDIALSAVQSDVAAIKTAVDGISGISGGVSVSTNAISLYYAKGEITENAVLWALNGDGQLRKLDVSADGFTVAYRIYADGRLIDERVRENISFAQSLCVTLKEPLQTDDTVILFAEYDLGV